MSAARPEAAGSGRLKVSGHFELKRGIKILLKFKKDVCPGDGEHIREMRACGI